MDKHLNDFRFASMEGQGLRLPMGPEHWGFAGPHRIHDLPPLGVAVACRWAWGAGRGVVAWLAGRRRRAVDEGRAQGSALAPMAPTGVAP